MPRSRPPTTGYARIAQAEELSDDEENVGGLINSYASLPLSETPQYASIARPGLREGMRSDGNTTPTASRRPQDRQRLRSNSSGVDIKAINARLEKWAEDIASRFKTHRIKGKTNAEEGLEIHHSVFQAPETMRPADLESWTSRKTPDRIMKAEFEESVDGIRHAIDKGVHPKMISQGSSGSYFVRDAAGKTVGVFKPKDEEPYAAGNPKWNKWIHRNLFPCFFGRACLIPNLSYVSEAAAYTLDCRLQTHLVPYTGIVHLSSKSFHYDFWDRRNYQRRRKPFPAKVGSLQVFLKGFQDANVFLRENPWPDSTAATRSRMQEHRKSQSYPDLCRPSKVTSTNGDTAPGTSSTTGSPVQAPFMWTDSVQLSFREELEKLVILDYIMRNTDRGLDNWMIKIDTTQSTARSRDGPSITGSRDDYDQFGASEADSMDHGPVDQHSTSAKPYQSHQQMHDEPPKDAAVLKVKIGAIDNSLSWPWKHPDAWRSFPFGWLFLPVSLIGQPFSQKTKDHFLPLLTSKQWWTETQLELRKVFSLDTDFQEKMFARQIAVMKGQAWNVVETLKTRDHGPLELTRRSRVCVWDDVVEIPVALPLRPSIEIRRPPDYMEQKDFDEMDIGIANGSSQVSTRAFNPSLGDMPNPRTFEPSSGSPRKHTRKIIPGNDPNLEAPGSASLTEASRPKRRPEIYSDHAASLPKQTRSSYDGVKGSWRSGPHHSRALSFSMRTRSHTYFPSDIERVGR